MQNECYKCRLDSDRCGHYDHTSTKPCAHFQKPIDNSMIFSHWYAPIGRISRMEYIFTLVLSMVMGVVLTYGVAWLFPSSMISDNNLHNLLLNIAVFGVPCYFAIIAGIKRANDAGLPRIWAFIPVLFLFVPNIITLVLFILSAFFLAKDKGEDGINQYGSNPSQPYDAQLTD